MSYAALVLAAGDSTRMGRPKATAQLDGRRLLEMVLASCRQAQLKPIVVVLGKDAELIRSAVDLKGVTVVLNPKPESGRTSSIKVGLGRIPIGAEAALIFPVDIPLVDAGVATTLIARHRSGRAPVLLPSFEGRRGHPVLFDRHVFRAIEALKSDQPLRELVQAYGNKVQEVPVDTPAILMDLNTPEDLKKAQAWLDAKRRLKVEETRRRARGK